VNRRAALIKVIARLYPRGPILQALSLHPELSPDIVFHAFSSAQSHPKWPVFWFYNHLKGEGLITRDEMQTSCCYAVQDKTWVHDPDGNEWEVFVVLEDNLPEAAEPSASACCVAGEATAPCHKLALTLKAMSETIDRLNSPR
jgi:hypothetical protein